MSSTLQEMQQLASADMQPALGAEQAQPAPQERAPSAAETSLISAATVHCLSLPPEPAPQNLAPSRQTQPAGADDDEEEEAPPPAAPYVNPDRFFLHTKHVLNRVEEAVFASPVLVRPDTSGPFAFGSLYHFPPLAQPARLAGQGDGNNPPPREPSQVVASVLAKARKPITAPPLCEPSPPCRTLESKPNPRLLQENHQGPFTLIRDFLTVKEVTLVMRLSHKMHSALFYDRKTHAETPQAQQYWITKFHSLMTGDYIIAPELPPKPKKQKEEVRPEKETTQDTAAKPKPKSQKEVKREKENETTQDTSAKAKPWYIDSVKVSYPWVRVLTLQQALALHKRQFDLDLVTAHQLEEPVRKITVEALTTQFRSRKHSCGVCTQQEVPYSFHLDQNRVKVVDIVYMACDPCRISKLWTTAEALQFWRIPEKMLEQFSHWHLKAQDSYQTQDLLRAFRQMKREDFKEIAENEVLSPTVRRYLDLPAEVRKVIKLEIKRSDVRSGFLTDDPSLQSNEMDKLLKEMEELLKKPKEDASKPKDMSFHIRYDWNAIALLFSTLQQEDPALSKDPRLSVDTLDFVSKSTDHADKGDSKARVETLVLQPIPLEEPAPLLFDFKKHVSSSAGAFSSASSESAVFSEKDLPSENAVSSENVEAHVEAHVEASESARHKKLVE